MRRIILMTAALAAIGVSIGSGTAQASDFLRDLERSARRCAWGGCGPVYSGPTYYQPPVYGYGVPSYAPPIYMQPSYPPPPPVYVQPQGEGVIMLKDGSFVRYHGREHCQQIDGAWSCKPL